MPYKLNPFTGELDYYQSGSGGGTGGMLSETPSGTYDGVNKAFMVANTPIFIDVEGQALVNGDGYSLSGLNITFTNPPVSSGTTHSFYGGALVMENLTATGGVATATVTPVFVIANGQVMVNGDGYTLSGLTITFDNPISGTVHSFHN